MRLMSCFVGVILVFLSVLMISGQDSTSWSRKDAIRIGKAYMAKGRVSGEGFRVMSTNKSTAFNYRATWLTPMVIRATARLLQIDERLSADEIQQIIQEAEGVDGTVFLIELDAIEGAGVIPPDWKAFLQPAGLGPGEEGGVTGVNRPELYKVKGLAGTEGRDFKYERFWVVFPLIRKNGKPVFPKGTNEAELIIRILNKESKARFAVPSELYSYTADGVATTN